MLRFSMENPANKVAYPSFYTKFANVIGQTRKSEYSVPDTVISTKLTGVQWSMLNEAFNR